MIRKTLILLFLGVVQAPALAGCSEATSPAAQETEFYVEPLAERIVDSLPDEPLYWRIETFDTLERANDHGGPLSLSAEAAGRVWLFTLGPASEPGAGVFIAEIGPVPIIDASRYLLRVNHAGGPPGAMTSAHSHPGSEAFYALTGQLTQRTSHGVATLDAGETMNGHEPGMVMQLTSSGAGDLEQLVLFVVDAGKPFSSPESFE